MALSRSGQGKAAKMLWKPLHKTLKKKLDFNLISLGLQNEMANFAAVILQCDKSLHQ